jgi:hypothetical protein
MGRPRHALFLFVAVFVVCLLMFRAPKKHAVVVGVPSIFLRYVAPIHGPFLDCHISGGFGNQMLEMMSCVFVCLVTGRKLVMRSDMRGVVGDVSLLGNVSSFLTVAFPYLGLVSNDVAQFPDVTSLPPLSKTLVGSSSTLDFVCTDLKHLVEADRIALRLPVTGSCFFLTGHMLALNRHFAPLLAKEFGGAPYSRLAQALFRPVKRIADEIDLAFAGVTSSIGVHVRFGQGAKDLYWNSDDPVAMARAVIRCLEPWLTWKTKIYLATDDLRIRDFFRLRFGDETMMGTSLATPPDNVRHDWLVRDMFSLARTTRFIGTYFSSVTTQVALQREYDEPNSNLYLLKNGSCVNFEGGDMIWPKDVDFRNLYPSAGVVWPNTACANKTVQQMFGL